MIKSFYTKGPRAGTYLELHTFKEPDRKIMVGLSEISSLAEGPDGRTYICMHSSQIHCVRESYDELTKFIFEEDVLGELMFGEEETDGAES